MAERTINLFASIITILNIVIALPQAFNPNWQIIGITFFSESNLFFRLATLLILESCLSYLLVVLIKFVHKMDNVRHILTILFCIISVSVTFYNVEHILIGHKIGLDLLKNAFIGYLILFGFFWALSLSFFIIHDLDFDNEPIGIISLTVLYTVFYLSLFFIK